MAKAIYIQACKTIVSGSESFQEQVCGYLDTIQKTKVGTTLLCYFGTKAPSKVVESPKEDAALVILQYGLKKIDKSDPVCTKFCINWKDDGASRGGLNDKEFLRAQKLPLIRLPAEGWKQTLPGVLKIDKGVFLGHKDFGDQGATMDIVLFHELCHAYLMAAAISPKWDGRVFKKAAPLTCADKDAYVAIEEQVVCGLAHGRGLDCCENAYRLERGLPPRTSYLAVGIPKDNTLGGAFEKTWAEGAEKLKEGAKTWGTKIAAVLKANNEDMTKVTELFGKAREVTDLDLDIKNLPKLERKGSALKLDAEKVDEVGNLEVDQ